MKLDWKTFGKLLLLVALAVTTSLVTSTVLAWGGHAKKRVASSTAFSDPSMVPTMVGPVQQTSIPAQASNGLASVTWLRVEPFADGFHVSGQANLRDARPDAAYVWSIRIRDPVKRVVVAENRYETQIFQLPRDTHELSPTFDDTFMPSLPPGTYKLELVLYEIPPGGVGLLRNPVVRERHLMAKNTVQVTIGG